jgi:hypothetical protein
MRAPVLFALVGLLLLPLGSALLAAGGEPGSLSVGGPPLAAASSEAAAAAPSGDYYPLLVLAIGIVSVLGLIIGLKTNAFLALIISALIVSLMAAGDPGERMQAVVAAFGSSAGGVGIVIAGD